MEREEFCAEIGGLGRKGLFLEDFRKKLEDFRGIC